jgi:hypothetical protein
MVPTDLRLRRSIVVAAGVAALAVGGVVMVWPAPTAPPSPAVAPVVDERVVAGPLNGRTAAWLTVGDAAARVRVRFARLPGLLYRISTAADAGLVPVVSRRDGRVTLRLTEAVGDGLDEVRIVLNRSVRWDIRLPAGAGEQQLNLRDGRVQRVEVGAAGLAEVWLPEPDGTVPVVFTGGIGTAVVSVRRGVPVRVHLAEGAGSVETPWIANNGTGADTVLREPDFTSARDRFAIRAEGGIGTLVIRRPPDHKPLPDVPGAVVRQPEPGPGPASGDRRPGPAKERPGQRGSGPEPAGRETRRGAAPGQPRRDTTSTRPDRGAGPGVPSRPPMTGGPTGTVAGGGEPGATRAPSRPAERPRVGKTPGAGKPTAEPARTGTVVGDGDRPATG